MDANLLDHTEDEAPELLDVPRWTVDLHMQFNEIEARSPVDAVSQFLVSILYNDMRDMKFTVHDRDSDGDAPAVVVRAGQVCSEGLRDAQRPTEDGRGAPRAPHGPRRRR